MKDQKSLTFFVSTGAYIIILTILLVVLKETRGLPTYISILDLFLIIFATLRLTELLVYDKIFSFVRDLFKGESHGVKKTADDLLSCPWCTGIWTATFVVFLYYLVPYSWIVILTLAVSGAAPVIQLWINSKK